MKIKYFGTGAAEGVPGIFCNCDVCKRSKAAGGRNIRTRSQALIDGELLIDFPADTYMHVLNYGLDLTGITKCLITHCHSDHLYPLDFEMRKFGFAYINPEGDVPPLDIYISGASSEAFYDRKYEKTIDEKTLRINTVKAFEPFELEHYRITPLSADHDRRIEPLFYMIEKDGKTLLYANDTGYFLDEVWEYFSKTQPHFDFVSLDCTGVLLAKYRTNHMSLEANADVKKRLIEMGCADEKTVFCCHHFSHNGGLTYDEFVPEAAKEGFLVSYDTMEIEF